VDQELDVAAFAASNGDSILRFAFMVTGGRTAEAEDIVQTVFLRVSQRGLAGIEDPAAYCRRAVVNEHASLRRRATVALRALPRLLERRHDEPGLESDERLTVLHALLRLTPREREAIILRYYEDLDDEIIAGVLACSRSTVRSLVHRALPKLKLALEAEHASSRPAPKDTK
jgi:RNA polymerase sigma factor (sigma-70 family)